MKTVYIGGEGEIVEKKSRFIATVRPVASEEEAVAFIAEMKKKYWDARHNCSAFVIGDRQELSRCSDDGEPAQTAGRPMLDVLLREEVHNAAVVVTRYFGGVLLGTGGLVRAYQGAVQAGLAASTIIDKKEGIQLTVGTDYTGLGKLQYLIAQQNLTLIDTAAWLEIPDFAIRMPLPAVFWNFVFSDISIIKHLPFRLQKSGSYFSSEESSRSFMLPYMPASFPRRASSNGMSAPAGSTSGL